jgi:hypothetical protein
LKTNWRFNNYTPATSHQPPATSFIVSGRRPATCRTPQKIVFSF